MDIYSKDQYYEAKLQLRPKDEKVLKYVYNQMAKSDCKISKEEKVKGGFDIYVTSRKFLTQLARKLKKNFKGDVKVSKTLFSVNRLTSRKVYRLTVLFRLKNEEEQ